MVGTAVTQSSGVMSIKGKQIDLCANNSIGSHKGVVPPPLKLTQHSLPLRAPTPNSLSRRPERTLTGRTNKINTVRTDSRASKRPKSASFRGRPPASIDRRST